MFTKFKIPLHLLAITVVFLVMVYYNFLIVQRDIRDTKQSPLSVELVSYPEKIKIGGTGNFTWRVNSSSDLSTSFTTIYWGYESSPSALQKTDSPDAVRYPMSQLDYSSGTFSLPDTFDVNIQFPKRGKIWFRAYTKVKGDNLWSEEKSVEVTN
jgi:hypothetical protein